MDNLENSALIVNATLETDAVTRNDNINFLN